MGHQDGFNQGVQGDVCGNLALRLERIAGSPIRVADQVQRAGERALHFLDVSASHLRVHSHFFQAPFVMRSSTNASPDVWLIDDLQKFKEIKYRETCEFERLGA